MKEKVLTSFCIQGGTLRVVLATTAFGMGINCPDIKRVIHWGPPSTLEQYAQESGRVGRNGNEAERVQNRFIDEDVKAYSLNGNICRHTLLYKDFLFASINSSNNITGCYCCDVCEQACNCNILCVIHEIMYCPI